MSKEHREILARVVERGSVGADDIGDAIRGECEVPGAAQITVKEALSAMSEVAQGQWKPIETAPNDQTIVVYRDNGVTELIDGNDNDYTWQKYDGKNQNVIGISKPTHWRYLPSPPTDQEANESGVGIK